MATPTRKFKGIVGNLCKPFSTRPVQGHLMEALEIAKEKKDFPTFSRAQKFLPFSHFLTDLHGREHDYLRISISER